LGKYNFKTDLNTARITEEEVALLLASTYNLKVLSFEDTNKYDILMTLGDGEPEYKFEVKEDFFCKKSGNVGVEFECRGKPSGIQTTESQFYVYKIHTKEGIVFVMHATGIIKKMIESKKYFAILSGGDTNSNTMLYLFKLDVFLSTGRIIPVKKD
jgi:hypothetical protein